jgi:hypothetical protein
MNTRITLATTKKHQLSVFDYYAKMCHYADDLAASGNPLRDDELVSYLLASLDEDFNPVFAAIVARVDLISPTKLYAHLLSFEQHTNLQGTPTSGTSSSALSATRGRGSFGARGSGRSSRGNSCGRGHGHGPSRGGFNNQSEKSSGSSSGSSSRHNANCNSRSGIVQRRVGTDMKKILPLSRAMPLLLLPLASRTTGTPDSGAMDHITDDLDKLTMHDTYLGNDQIHVANESGMNITRIGNTIIPTSSRNLVLNNVLHVPTTHKNLISVHRFTLDNDTYIEFYPYFFLNKDQKTRKVLLHGPYKGGLYPLPPSTSKFWKLVFSAIKLSVDRWHNRLGHSSQEIVHCVISTSKLPCSHITSSSESVCDAYACAKAHQLPYPVSSSRSSAPLKLVFSDVCGSGIDSFSHKKYYVSFIDDYSKFAWIYLLHHKFEVSKYFLEFQALVERLLDRKIVAVQSDWVGNMRN